MKRSITNVDSAEVIGIGTETLVEVPDIESDESMALDCRAMVEVKDILALAFQVFQLVADVCAESGRLAAGQWSSTRICERRESVEQSPALFRRNSFRLDPPKHQLEQFVIDS